MTAAAAALAEAGVWAALAREWAGRDTTEADVVGFYDPESDLNRRAEAWGHRLGRHGFADLARFAAALAQAEAGAWEADQPQVATHAYENRRLLLGDRIVHWVVPWLDALDSGEAAAAQAMLLALGDVHRPAPDLASGEGTAPPGEDGFGPIVVAAPLAERLRSLWSGLVLPPGTAATASRYEQAAKRWRDMAAEHPGTAALWRDLAVRADRTAAELRSTSPSR